ncbi:MAG: hypothetical protein IJV36_07085 [Prevotella sp.]|nr:hypothetical protein [Prevotella sp.]
MRRMKDSTERSLAQLLMVFGILFSIASYGQTKKVAILETVDKEGNVPYAVKLMLRSSITQAISDTPGYEGYERVDVGSILNEQDFQRTGLVKESEIKQLGEMAGADYILVAEAAKLNESQIIIIAKILNVESARVEETANLYSNIDAEGLDKNCKTLARKLLKLNLSTGAAKREVVIDGNRYEGEIVDGKPHGKGTMYFASSDANKRRSYEGNWANGLMEGNGTMTWQNDSKYVGDWSNNQQNGTGVLYYSNGRRYEGNFRNGVKHGQGTFIWTNGEKYIGNWDDDKIEGYGIYYYADGSRYEGNWTSGVINGKGTMYYSPNDELHRVSYEGGWQKGHLHGTGTMIWSTGQKYVGGWDNDNQHGAGIFYKKNGARDEATWVNGEKQGRGRVYGVDGSRLEGMFVDDEMDGKWEKWVGRKNTATWTFKKGELKKVKNH